MPRELEATPVGIRFPDDLSFEGMDNRAGTLSATFQVEAPSRDEAAFVGCLAYWQAVREAGLDLNADSRVEVRPGDAPESDDVERFSAPPRGGLRRGAR